MDAAALLRRNELDAALSKLLDQVRAYPADAKLRIFLFQLCCVTGDWTRAKTQLEVIAGLDKGALMMTRIYGDALACEAERRRDEARVGFGDGVIVFDGPGELARRLVRPAEGLLRPELARQLVVYGAERALGDLRAARSSGR